MSLKKHESRKNKVKKTPRTHRFQVCLYKFLLFFVPTKEQTVHAPASRARLWPRHRDRIIRSWNILHQDSAKCDSNITCSPSTASTRPSPPPPATPTPLWARVSAVAKSYPGYKQCFRVYSSLVCIFLVLLFKCLHRSLRCGGFFNIFKLL